MTKKQEFVYDAKNIDLSRFKSFCSSIKPGRVRKCHGEVHLYDHASGSRCTHDVVAGELRLAKSSLPSGDRPEAFLAELGYFLSAAYLISSVTYSFEYYDFSYNAYFNAELDAHLRTVSLSSSEFYPWTSEQEAFSELVARERLSKSLGISSKCRIQPDLSKMFSIR